MLRKPLSLLTYDFHHFYQGKFIFSLKVYPIYFHFVPLRRLSLHEHILRICFSKNARDGWERSRFSIFHISFPVFSVQPGFFVRYFRHTTFMFHSVGKLQYGVPSSARLTYLFIYFKVVCPVTIFKYTSIIFPILRYFVVEWQILAFTGTWPHKTHTEPLGCKFLLFEVDKWGSLLELEVGSRRGRLLEVKVGSGRYR